MLLVRTVGLFILTALAEIVGCYLPYLWLKRGGSAWLVIPAAFSLALFAWLLTLHPAAAGRIYAAYGGDVRQRSHIVFQLWKVDGVRRLSAWVFTGATVALISIGRYRVGWLADVAQPGGGRLAIRHGAKWRALIQDIHGDHSGQRRCSRPAEHDMSGMPPLWILARSAIALRGIGAAARDSQVVRGLPASSSTN